MDDPGGDILVLGLEGTFDAAVAWRLHETLAQLDAATRVSLDFREVRAFHDFAVALLARDLLARRGRIQVAGLCQHQRRILRYFGVDEAGLGDSGAPGDGAPREMGGGVEDSPGP